VSGSPTLTYLNVQSNLIHSRNFLRLFAGVQGKRCRFLRVYVCVVCTLAKKKNLLLADTFFTGSSTEELLPFSTGEILLKLMSLYWYEMM